MINGGDIYKILCAIVPMYVAMIIAYASVKWLKFFSPEQIAGINRCVALIMIPFLVFDFLARSDPYKMDLRVILADTLQKVIVMVVFGIWCGVSRSGSLKWSITLSSVATIPNVVVVGIPILTAMYGDEAKGILIEIVVLQLIIWTNLLLAVCEYEGAVRLVRQGSPDISSPVTSIRVDSDVHSLDGKEPIQAEAGVGEDNKLHVIIRKSDITHFDSGVTTRINSETHPTVPFASVDKRSLKSSTYPMRRSFSFDSIDFNSTCNVRNINTVNPKQTNGSMSVNGEISHPGPKKFPPNGTVGKDLEDPNPTSVPSKAVLAKLILIMVWRKLSKNPTIHASLVGLAWSLISSRLGIKMPVIVDNSITILSKAGIGMAMFSVGLFMSVQPRIISCGKQFAVLSMATRFLVGPGVMAVASYAVGLRGKVLQIAIVQAALPQALVLFIFAKEYNIHPEIQSTGVIIGMLVSLPVTIIYYILLGLD